MTAEIEIKIEKVNKNFGDFCCLRDVNLGIIKGELHTLLGPSGCGKTTLLRMIAGLEPLNPEGRILHGDEVVKGPSAKRGFIFQREAAFPWRTVIKNIEFGLELKGIPEDKKREISRQYIKLVGLNGFEKNYPHQISGGMKQKMVIATVLANEPEVILMDEPFGALDAQTRAYMQRELLRIWERTKKTIIFVTHSIREALIISNRVSLFGIRPGCILKTYDLDTLIGTQTNRNFKDEKVIRLESELYTRLQTFFGSE